MSIELNFRDSALAAVVARFARRALAGRCLPSLPGGQAFVDHAAVVDAGVRLVPTGGVVLQLPLDVYVVTRGALLAAPNAEPAGASGSPQRIVLAWAVRAEVDPAGDRGSRVRFDPLPPDLGPLGGLLGALGDALRNAVALPALELGDVFKDLELPTPHSADTALVAGVLALRFDAERGPAVVRLGAGQDWGLFVSGSTWAEGARREAEQAIGDAFTGLQVSAQWHADGAASHVDVRAGITAEIEASTLFDIGERITVRAWAGITGAPSLVSPWPDALLRVDFAWALHLDTPLGGAIEGVVEGLLEDLLEDALDPADFHAVSTGPRRFARDQALPALSMAGASLHVQQLAVGDAGTTLGGTLVPAAWAEPPFHFQPGQLQGPERRQICSELARVGSDRPDRTPLTLDNTSSRGTAVFEGTGTVCERILVSGPPGFDAFVQTVPAADGRSVDLRARIPYRLAQEMTAPLRFIVRTPRGVRLVDFGIAPKAVLNAEGRIVNGRDTWLPDCLYFSGSGLQWGRLPGSRRSWSAADFKPPPLEDPGWTAFVRAGGGLSLQWLTLTRLEPGELLHYRSATHAIDLSADADGRAVVPALLPLQAAMPPALLQRANGRPLAGHVTVRTLAFEAVAALPVALAPPRLAVLRSGHAVLRTRAGGESLLQVVAPDGTLARLRTRRGAADEVALNPQPLPPEPPPEVAALLQRVPGVVRTIALPGADGPATVALRRDGSRLLLDRQADGSLRVAGSFTGPVGVLQVQAGWAVASGRAGVQVLRTRT